METLLKSGASVYDMNTGQTGAATSDTYEYTGPRGGLVIDVAWDNGDEETVYAAHVHAFIAR